MNADDKTAQAHSLLSELASMRLPLGAARLVQQLQELFPKPAAVKNRDWASLLPAIIFALRDLQAADTKTLAARLQETEDYVHQGLTELEIKDHVRFLRRPRQDAKWELVGQCHLPAKDVQEEDSAAESSLALSRGQHAAALMRFCWQPLVQLRL